MKGKKTTRRALVMSLLSLLLCCSMLVGTTFAWFTDSVTSGRNKIVAGNLDVTLDYYDAATKTFKEVTSDVKLFDETHLWEPGHTEIAYLKVANAGTLALKYQLLVNVYAEQAGTNVYDKAFKLSDYLVFKVIEIDENEVGTFTRETARAEAGTELGLKAFEGEVKALEKTGDADYVMMVIYMPESVDNNANYKTGTTAPSIEMGVVLNATQFTYEEDSFDKNYDMGAVYADVTVSTAAELKAALAAGKKTIGIMGKIQLTEGMNASDVTLVGASSDAAIDFATHNLAGSGTITYRNLKLTTQSLPYAPENGERYGWYGGIDYLGHSVANYEGCEISGVFTTYSNTVNISDCTFLPYVQNGEEFYHIFVYSSTTVNVEDSTFYYGDRAIKIYNEGGVKDTVLNVSDSSFKADETFTAVVKPLINVDASSMNSVKLNVSNITVDEKLKSAAIYSDSANKVTATVDGVVTTAKAATQTELNDALAGGDVAIELAAGEYTMPSVTGTKEITITGTKDTVIDNTMGSYMESSKISFEGVTIKGSTGMANGNGSDYAALYSPNVTYTNCTFDGPFRIGRDGATFIGCTFTNLGNDYVWTYGNDCTFIDCTFNSDGKALLIYSDGGNEVSKVTVKDCTFNATQGAKAGAISNQNCAAIEIHNYGNGVDLTTSGNTIDTEFSGEWRIKTYETGKPAVIVNGVTYTTIALDGKLMTISGTTVTVQ